MGDVATMRPTYVLDRGNYASPQKDKELQPGVPKQLQFGGRDLAPNLSLIHI